MRADIEVPKLQLEIQQLQKNIAEKERKNVELARTNQMAVVERENVMKMYVNTLRYKKDFIVKLISIINEQILSRLSLISNKQQDRDLNSLKEKIRLLEQERSKVTEWSRSTDTEKELDQLRVQVRDMEQELVRQR